MSPQEIREKRKSLGMSQKEFAEALRVDRKTVVRWENGQRKPDNYSQRSLEALKIEPNWTLRRARRRLLGISQEKFAKEIGVSTNTVILWESDKVIPKKGNRKKIEILTGISERILFPASSR